MKHIDFKPDFYDQFQCVGPQCSDSCCTHWHIFVDQPTYEFMIYKSKLKDQAPQAFVRTPQGSDYAEINLDEQKRCRLLDDEGWCLVHKLDGLEHLSNTCRLFPRKALHRGNSLTEHVLMLSCPEVVRMLIQTPEMMVFDRLDTPEPQAFDATDYHLYRRPHGYRTQLDWMHAVIDSDYSIEEKLYILSDGVTRLNKYVGHPPNFTSHLIAMAQSNYQEQQVESFHQVKVNTNLQGYLYIHFLELLQGESYTSVMEKSPRLQALLDRLVALFKQDERPITKIKKVLEQPPVSYHLYHQSRPWITSNYLLYRMYMDDVPSMTSGQFFYYFLYEFFYISTTLKLIAAEDVLTDEDVIWVIQSFHKSISGRTFVRLLDELDRDYKALTGQALKPLRLLAPCPFQSKSRNKATLCETDEGLKS